MKKFKPILAFLLFTMTLTAQVEIERDVVASAGDEMTNGNLSLEWTVGEVMTETYQQPSLVICQGFHLGDHQAVSTAEMQLPYAVNVFPNPTDATLCITTESSENLNATLFDMTGKLLMDKSIVAALQHTMSLEQLPAATYLLRLANNEGQSTIFKIQKINTK